MKYKIAFLIPTMHKGGAEKIAAELSKELSKDFEIYLIVFDKKISYEYNGKIISLGIPMEKGIKEFSNILKRVRKLNKILEKEKINLVMSFDEIASIVNLFSNREVKKVIAIHKSLEMADEEKSLIRKIIARIIRKLYNKACKVICVSKGIKKELIKFGVDKKRIEVVYNPFDIKRIRKKAMEKEEIELPKKYILNIGRAERQKGQWHLIKAFKKVKEKDKDVKLILLSRGSLISYLKKLIKKEGLENEVIVVEDWIKNVYPLIRKAKAVVLSSLFEGFPNVLNESLIIGTPIISTDCKTGPSEIIEGSIKKGEGYVIGKRGLLVEKMDGNMDREKINREEEKLGEAILLLLDDRKLREKFEKNTQEYLKSISKEEVVKKYKKILKDCIEKI